MQRVIVENRPAEDSLLVVMDSKFGDTNCFVLLE